LACGCPLAPGWTTSPEVPYRKGLEDRRPAYTASLRNLGNSGISVATDLRLEKRLMLVAGLLVGSVLGSATSLAAEQVKPPAKASAAAPSRPYRYRRPLGGMPASARQYYAMSWGVDQLSAKLAESGQLVRFNYRVTDAAKAKAVFEKASSPYLLDEKVHAVLQVPTMEKVGPLRQTGVPENGKFYWMVFSNKGNVVRAGHRVSVVIGQFRVDGLVVQ
jgi:hypothetical protein